MRAALQASLARLPRQSRIGWLMDRAPEEPQLRPPADGAGAGSGAGAGAGAEAAAKSGGRPSDPAQITLLVSGMQYVRGVEDALDACERGDAGALASLLAGCVSDLNDLIRLTQTSLSRGDRARVMAMITLDAHGRDIIKKLMDEGVTSRAAFQWQSQLKQRLEMGADGAPRATLAVADAHFDYQFEYLGNGPRLVVTPLTDRIYVTATQALHLRMGCAPAGPAGTGKTETTKDLANAMAITCLVFNCSPEMDYMSLGCIFKGLAASGSWGCVSPPPVAAARAHLRTVNARRTPPPLPLPNRPPASRAV